MPKTYENKGLGPKAVVKPDTAIIDFPVGVTCEGIVTAEFNVTDDHFSLCTDVHYPFVFDASREADDIRDHLESCFGKEDMVKFAEANGFDRTEFFPDEDDEDGEYFDTDLVTDDMYEGAIDYLDNRFRNNDDELFEFQHDCSCAHGAQVTIDGNTYDFESICGGQHDPRKDEPFYPYDKQLVDFIYKLWDKYHLKSFDKMTDAELQDIQNGIDTLNRAGYLNHNKYRIFDTDSEALTALTKEWLQIDK